MQSYSATPSTEQDSPITARWLAMFEDRHGAGSYQQLRTLLARPCVTFAEIAARFRVTRECVRQWHLLVMPDAPRGHARQRLCGHLRQRRRLLDAPLFRAFFTHIRRDGREHRLELLRSGTGYRSRVARIDGKLVVIREARAMDAGATAGARAYAVASYRGPAEFMYVRLAENDYLFLPSTVVTTRLLIAAGPGQSPFETFRNSFAALRTSAPTSHPPPQ